MDLINQNNEERNIKIRRVIIEILGTILGSFTIATGIALFLLPNQLSSGGVAGIATITYYLFNIPMGTMMVLINVPLFLVSIFKMGKYFFVKSMIGTVTLSIFIDFLDKFKALTEDRFLACVYGGIILGIGTAILLKVNSSTGGSDLVSYVVKKYKPTVQAGNIIVIIDIVIVTLNMIFFNEIEIGLYSAIAIYLMGKIIDILFEGIDFTKLMIIVSDKSEEISKDIEEKIERGVTGLYGKGMYTNSKKLVLMCVAPRREVARIKMLARKIDPRSFIIITNSREVVGQGFEK